jgi:hypothetical protein
MTYCTTAEVKRLSGVKPQHLRLSQEDEEGLDEILTQWIRYSESLIDSFCRTTFDPNIPGVVSMVCAIITANMVAFSQTRKDTPLTKVNDWNVQVPTVAIFPNDLKEDLKPFRVEKSNVSDSIDFFAITGD